MSVSRFSIIFLMASLFTYGTIALAADNPNKGSSNPTSLSFEQVKVAAQRGDADAQYALGYLYYYGKNGALKDVFEAKKWIEKAAQQKQPQAVKALALINRQQNRPQPVTNPASQGNEVKKVASNDTTTEEIVAKKPVKKPFIASRMPAEPAEEETTPIVATNNEKGLYTLQLLGAYQKEQVMKMIDSHHLSSKAQIYQTKFNNKDWYVLLYGRYNSVEEAKTEAKQLEASLMVRPWVKPYADVKGNKVARF